VNRIHLIIQNGLAFRCGSARHHTATTLSHRWGCDGVVGLTLLCVMSVLYP
jgi:hypothetical protein